jgi:PAS domain-containing protein
MEAMKTDAVGSLEARDILRRVLDCMNELLLVVDGESLRLLEANHRAAVLLKYSVPSLLAYALMTSLTMAILNLCGRLSAGATDQ